MKKHYNKSRRQLKTENHTNWEKFNKWLGEMGAAASQAIHKKWQVGD